MVPSPVMWLTLAVGSVASAGAMVWAAEVAGAPAGAAAVVVPRCATSLEGPSRIRWAVVCAGLGLVSAEPPTPLHLHPVASFDLSRNRVQRLGSEQFTDFPELNRLNLSSNGIAAVDRDAFNGLGNLLELDLSRNALEALTADVTAHLPKLKILVLSRNRLKTIAAGALRPVPMLVRLSLDGNAGLAASPADYRELDEPLKRRLVFLDLAGTTLTDPPDGDFNSTSLLTLNLARNPLKSVPSAPASLRSLDLSETLIESLLPGDFERFDALQRLALENMPLLTQIRSRALSGLNHLEELYVKNCPKLEFISESAFGETVPNLRKVVISNCSVETLRNPYESLLRDVRYVDLQFNPWLCDGKTYWISELSIYPNLTENLRCNKPDAAKGVLMSDYFRPQTRSLSSLLHGAIIIALAAVLVGGVVAMVHHMTKEEARSYRQIHQDICLQERPSNTLTPL